MQTLSLTLDAYIDSLAIAEYMGAQRYHCWRNAVIVTLISELTYIEGWAVLPRSTEVEIIEHGWCQALDGKPIDPSIVLVEPSNQPIFYFPGWQLSRDALVKLLPQKVLPLVAHTDYGDDGLAHAGYKAAYEQAWDLARQLTHKLHLPATAISVIGRQRHLEMTMMITEA